MKTCPRCKTIQSFAAFHKLASAKDGRQYACIECCKKAASKRRGPLKRRGPPRVLSDAERYTNRLASRKRTYEKNKIRVLATSAIYRGAHKEREGVVRRAHYERNKEHVAKVTQAYRLANPGLYRAASARRKAAQLRATPAWASPGRIAAIYDAVALLSEFMGAPYEVDHIVPLQSKFVCGLHCETNLEIIPRRDNRRKGNSTWPGR